MICSKCGHEINGVVKFCPKCGNPMVEAEPTVEETPAVEEAPVEEAPVEEAPVEETPVAEEAPAYEETVTEQLSPEQLNSNQQFSDQQFQEQQPYYSPIPEAAPTKKKFGIKAIIIIVVAVIAVAAAVGAIFYFNKAAFTSGKKLLKDSISNAVDDSFADSAAFYDENTNLHKDGTVTTTLTLDEGLKDMLEDYGTDLDWLDSAHFTINVSGDDEDLLSMDMVGGINNVDVVSLVYLMDLSKEMGYMQIPELSDQYVKFDFSSFSDEDIDALFAYYKNLNGTEQQILSSDEMRKLAVKYTELALDEIDDVDKDKEEIEADGVEAKYYALSTTIDERTIAAMSVAVGNEILEDKDLKEAMRVMYDYEKSLETAYGSSYSYDDYLYEDFDEFDVDDSEDFDDWYEDFLDGVESTVKEQEKTLKKLEKHDETGEEYGVLNVYVDNKGELKGIDFEPENEDGKLYAYYPEDGDEFGMEIGFESAYSSSAFVGSGTNDGGIINGEFRLESDDSEILEIEVIDYDSDEYKKGNLIGEFVLTPGEDAYFGYDTFSTMMATMSYDFVFKATGDETDCSISLKSDTTAFATLDVKVTYGDVDAHSVPKDAIDALDDESMEAYAESIDFNTLIDNLKEAGVPSEYLEFLEQEAEYMY